MRFVVGTSEAMRITSAGNVGIGTTSVTADYDKSVILYGGNPSYIVQTNDNTGYGYFHIKTPSYDWSFGYDGANNFKISNGTHPASSTKFTITSAGNVGIGTSSPNDLLELKSTSVNNPSLRLYSTFNAGASDYGINWYRDYDSATNAIAGYIRYNRGGGSAGEMLFGTGTNSGVSERMRITSGGNVLIGGTSTLGASGTNLEISGGRAQLVVNSTTETASWFSVYPAGDGNTYILRNTGYSFLFGTATSQTTAGFVQQMTISSNGSIGAPSGTNIYNASDIRLKKNISTTTYGLDAISALNPVKFNWVDGFEPSEDGKDMLGFIAQEMQNIIPEAVESFGSSVDLNGTIILDTLRVNEKFIIPVLVKAIQELSAENTSLINRIEALENK